MFPYNIPSPNPYQFIALGPRVLPRRGGPCCWCRGKRSRVWHETPDGDICRTCRVAYLHASLYRPALIRADIEAEYRENQFGVHPPRPPRPPIIPPPHLRKITDEVARQIRERYARGGILQSELAQEYGVSRAYMNAVIKGRRPRHA